MARRLAELAPEPLGKVLLAPSGNDAKEIALRLARVATGRFKTVSFFAILDTCLDDVEAAGTG